MSSPRRIVNFFSKIGSNVGNGMEFLWKNFGINLRVGAGIVAMFQMTVSLMKMLLLVILCGLVTYLKSSSEKTNDVTIVLYGLFQFLIISGFLFQLFWFSVNVFLVKGIWTENDKTLDRAWTLMLVGILVVVALKIFGVALFGSLELREILVLVPDIGLDLVSLWVVTAYKEKLQRGADIKMGQEKGKQNQEDNLEKMLILQ